MGLNGGSVATDSGNVGLGGEVGGGVKRGGGWGDEGGLGIGGGVTSPLNIWLPHVPKSPLKPTILEILEKSLYYLYLLIGIGLDR